MSDTSVSLVFTPYSRSWAGRITDIRRHWPEARVVWFALATDEVAKEIDPDDVVRVEKNARLVGGPNPIELMGQLGEQHEGRLGRTEAAVVALNGGTTPLTAAMMRLYAHSLEEHACERYYPRVAVPRVYDVQPEGATEFFAPRPRSWE